MQDAVEIRIKRFVNRDFTHDDRVVELVATAGDGRRLVMVHLPFEAYACLGPEESRKQLPMMLQYALPGVESGFRGGMYSCDGSDPVDVTISAYEVDGLKTTHAEVVCQWMKEGKSGPTCQASEPHFVEMTTSVACRACTVADDRVRCVDFVHPTTGPDGSVAVFTRSLRGSFCNSGDGESGADCNPWVGSQACWKRRVSVRRAAGEPPEDIGDRVADEIDFFTVAYGLASGQRKPWPIPQARSTAAFFGRCRDYKDFLLRSATIADLMDKLEAAATWGKVGDQNLTRFAAFVTETFPAVTDDAERLRSIHALRNLHPIHSQSKETAAFARLGLRYPPDSWDLAWRQVLSLLHDALRNLRRAMQSSL